MQSLFICCFTAVLFLISTHSLALKPLGSQAHTFHPDAQEHADTVFIDFKFPIGRLENWRIDEIYKASHTWQRNGTFYSDLSAANPEYFDKMVNEMYDAGAEPVINVIQSTVYRDGEDVWYPMYDLRNYSDKHQFYAKWFDIGKSLSERFAPGSQWNKQQGHGSDWGVKIYIALNEIDGPWYWNKPPLGYPGDESTENPAGMLHNPIYEPITLQEYYDINEAFAEGVKEGAKIVNPSNPPKVDIFLGPFAKSNLWSNPGYHNPTLRNSDKSKRIYGYLDYLRKVKPLFESGLITGFGMQTYFDVTDNFDNQANIRLQEGYTAAEKVLLDEKDPISQNKMPKFYVGEINSKKDPDKQGNYVYYNFAFSGALNALAVADRWGKPVTEFGFWFNPLIDYGDKKLKDFSFNTKQSFARKDFVPNVHGKMAFLINQLIGKWEFDKIDYANGLHRLKGGGETAWFLNAFKFQSDLITRYLGSQKFTISDIPIGTSSIKVYDWLSAKGYQIKDLKIEPALTIPRSSIRYNGYGLGSVDIQLELNHAYIIVADSE